MPQACLAVDFDEEPVLTNGSSAKGHAACASGPADAGCGGAGALCQAKVAQVGETCTLHLGNHATWRIQTHDDHFAC